MVLEIVNIVEFMVGLFEGLVEMFFDLYSFVLVIYNSYLYNFFARNRVED